MNDISKNFHNALTAEKTSGRDAARAFIRANNLEEAKQMASAASLSNEEARKAYGYWCGWIDACLEYRG